MKNAVHKSPNLGIKMSSNQKKTFSKLFLKLNFTKKMMIGNEKKIYLISLYPIMGRLLETF